MEAKLESLIQKIEQEAVDGAQAKADALLAEAQHQAERLVADARGQAQDIVAAAKRRAEEFRVSGETALQHAARDVELHLKERIEALFDRVFRRAVGATMDPTFLKELVLKIAQQWSHGGALEVTVSAADREALERLLIAGLQGDLKETIALSASTRGGKGIRIGVKGESVYYDFSEGAIAAALREQVSPRLRQTLDGSHG
jgi:vacuolar-type H+-ATPase subunit E/Vma4